MIGVLEGYQNEAVLTGLVLFAIGSYVITQGHIALMLFLWLIGVLAFYEVQLITELKSRLLMVTNMVFYTLLLGFLYQGDLVFGWPYLGLILMCSGLFTYEFFSKKLLFRDYGFLNNLKYFCYIYFGFSSVYLIRESSQGLLTIFVMFLAIWATDVFAYYGGKRFGKRQLSTISPNKTIEGTLSGVSAAMITVAIVCYLYQLSFVLVIGGAVIGLMGQLGDLYESLIKRTYSVKDSSNLLPGHGGI